MILARAAAVILLAVLSLAACEREAASPAAQAAPPAETAAEPRERAGPIRWNVGSGAFELAGRPLKATRLWTFDGSSEGFTAGRSQVALADGQGLVLTLVDPSVRSPTALEIEGWRYGLVLVRLTRLKVGGTWDGALYYASTTHGESAQFFAKPLSGADPAVNETTVLVYDMNRLAAGGDDWKNSLVDHIRIDLDGGAGGAFLVRQVAVVESVDPAALDAALIR